MRLRCDLDTIYFCIICYVNNLRKVWFRFLNSNDRYKANAKAIDDKSSLDGNNDLSLTQEKSK